jgi:hypothetical protein
MILELWKFVCSVIWRCDVGSAVCNVSTERNAVIYGGWWLKSSAFYDKYSTFLRNVMKNYQLHGVTIRTYELPCKTVTWDPHFPMQCLHQTHRPVRFNITLPFPHTCITCLSPLLFHFPFTIVCPSLPSPQRYRRLPTSSAQFHGLTKFGDKK